MLVGFVKLCWLWLRVLELGCKGEARGIRGRIIWEEGGCLWREGTRISG